MFKKKKNDFSQFSFLVVFIGVLVAGVFLVSFLSKRLLVSIEKGDASIQTQIDSVATLGEYKLIITPSRILDAVRARIYPFDLRVEKSIEISGESNDTGSCAEFHIRYMGFYSGNGEWFDGPGSVNGYVPLHQTVSGSVNIDARTPVGTVAEATFSAICTSTGLEADRTVLHIEVSSQTPDPNFQWEFVNPQEVLHFDNDGQTQTILVHGINTYPQNVSMQVYNKNNLRGFTFGNPAIFAPDTDGVLSITITRQDQTIGGRLYPTVGTKNILVSPDDQLNDYAYPKWLSLSAEVTRGATTQSTSGTRSFWDIILGR